MSDYSEETKEAEDQLDIIRKRFDAAKEHSADIRKEALDDLKFRAGEQWLERSKKERDEDGRPCLVINKMPQFERQITNDQKLNRSAIKVSPVDDKADVDTAKVFQGLIRHIENSCSADTAYDNAFEGAVRKGFGYFRVLTEFSNELSFNQDIKIARIDNDFSVYFDPYSKELDGSDAGHAFIAEELSKEEFNEQYPDAELAKMEDWASIGDQLKGWVDKEACRVVEYFCREFETKDLCLMQDGSTVLKDELPEQFKSLVVKERKTEIPKVKWYKTNGHEILEETEWPGRWIPIIPVYGERLVVDGKVILESVIRHAKDSQRMYNYWASTETETIALAPRAPFLVASGQITKEQEKFWKTANRKNHAYLPYEPISVAGQVIGAPQRNAYEAPIAAITSARMQSNDDIKATTGIYDASLGIKSNEQSGIAIQRRNIQSQTSNYHFISNLNNSKKHCARILLDLIPKIYDTAQAVRIIGEDDQEKIVRINEIFEENGQKKQFNLAVGKYDVIMETGPSFATKRQEAASAMIEMTKAFPQLAQIAGDLIVGNMDWPGAQDIQTRIRKTLAPGLADENGEKKEIPPEVQAQLGQMEQMIQQLSGSLQEQTEVIKNKRIELESKERIEFAKINAQLEIAKANLESKEALEGLKQSMSTLDDDIAMMKARMGLLNINEPFLSESGGNPAAGIQQNQIME
jgi:Phage P22-like portal protein